MSTDLGLDPSDALNLLLQNQGADSSMEDSPSDGSSPPDWSQLSSLWDGSDSATGGLKPYPDLMDFTDLNSLPMDMDFNPAMGMEPGALHYDPLKFNPLHFSYDDAAAFHNISAEMIPPQFSFTFQAALNASSSSFSSATPSLSPPESPNKERRLSMTSSSSSSAVSLSPVLESRASPSTSYISEAASPAAVTVKVEPKSASDSPHASDSASELAERVRQSAGVMLAVPMSGDLAQSIALAGSGPSHSKLSTPRAPRSAPRSPISSSSSAASTPPPSTPPMSSSLPNKLTIDAKSLSSASSSSSSLSTPIMPPLASANSANGTRPKTSHTTIERRYRTNLNARIQSLRMAVPALRVLEDRDGGNGKKIKKNLKDGIYVKGAGIGIDHEDGTTVDVIDERGFVDGVKVARKCSKANVLGKAVEYIRVLKKRETRLKAEQQGLKTLVCGLVGGPALLKEWEQRWRERFGGEEKDEVEGDDAEDEDSDDDEGDDDDEAAGRKRKRVKTAAPPRKPAAERRVAVPAPITSQMVIGDMSSAMSAPVPEKRKRGRPRKVIPPPMPVATLTPHLSHQQAAVLQHQQHQQQQQQQHFVNQQRDQVMLSPDGQRQPQAPQYMLAIFAIFSFFNSPFTSQFTTSGSSTHNGMVLTPIPLALAPETISQLIPATPVETSNRLLSISWAWKDYLHAFHLLVTLLVLGGFIWSWLGLTLKKKLAKETSSAPSSSEASQAVGSYRKADWSKTCDESVLKGQADSLSTISRLQMYYSLSSRKTASVAQLASLSLLINNVGGIFGFATRLKAKALWTTAKVQSELIQTKRSIRPTVKTVEKLVMETYELEEATQIIASASPQEKSNGETAFTPIEVLGARIVKERVRQHLGVLFVEAVSLTQDGVVIVEQEKEDAAKQFEVDVRRTIEAARELGGDVEELGRTLERVWKSTTAGFEDIYISGDDDSSDEDDEADQEQYIKRSPGGAQALDTEIRSLLTALVLYRRMFSGSNTPTVSSMLISPPPSPTSMQGVNSRASKEGEMLSLRKALGHRVFEDKEGLIEDARDKVVDLIVDTERRGRCGTPLA